MENHNAFEAIVGDLIGDAKVLCCEYESSEHWPGARRIVYLVTVGAVAVDLLHNSRDGLRGRYWQAPDRGDSANRYLISALEPKLLDFARQKETWNADNLAEAKKSISHPSAKAWVHEKTKKYANDTMHPEVPRWRANEAKAPQNLKYLWRKWWPDVAEIQVKGAFLSSTGDAWVPPTKRSRASDINQFGFA
ncbi:MAG TPA: hypothetical protein VH184_16755 [Dongiaceae bacterium]|nr:hypothetical protein [Dongiaceae bacterium]